MSVIVLVTGIALPWMLTAGTLMWLRRKGSNLGIGYFYNVWSLVGATLCLSLVIWRNTADAGFCLTTAVFTAATVILVALPFFSDIRERADIIVAGIVTLSALAVALMLILVNPSDDARSGLDAVADVYSDAISRSYEALAHNVKYMGIFLVLGPSLFLYHYESSCAKLRSNKQLRCPDGPTFLSKDEMPFVKVEAERSRGISSQVVAVISFFVFLSIMDTVGVSANLMGLFGTHLAMSLGWPLKDILGSFFTGFTMRSTSDMCENDIIQINGVRYKIIHLGKTHVQATLFDEAAEAAKARDDTSKPDIVESKPKEIAFIPNKMLGEGIFYITSRHAR